MTNTIDNTLIDYSGSERSAITGLFGKEYNYNLDESQIDYWSQISKSIFEDYLKKKLTFLEQGKLRFVKMGQNCEILIDEVTAENLFKNYQDELNNSWKLYDDVEETLCGLKDQRLGIISNGNAKQQQLKLTCTGIDHYFEIKVFSEDVGVAKPDAEIFKKAVLLSKEDNEHIIYVGDYLKTDILPCSEIGIKGVLIDRNNKYDTECDKISNLAELLKYKID